MSDNLTNATLVERIRQSLNSEDACGLCSILPEMAREVADALEAKDAKINALIEDLNDTEREANLAVAEIERQSLASKTLSKSYANAMHSLNQVSRIVADYEVNGSQYEGLTIDKIKAVLHG